MKIKFIVGSVFVALFWVPVSALAGTLAVHSSGDATTAVSPSTFIDDVALQFGTGGTVECRYETADANANALVCTPPEGGSTDVPVFVWGDASAENVDIGLFNGITAPTLAVLSDDHVSAVKISHDQTNAVIDTTEGYLTIVDPATITGVVTAAGTPALTVTQAAHTALTANQPAISVPTASLGISTGATIAIGSWLDIAAPTYTGVAGGGAETITDAATLYISGAPAQGANAVLTRTHALWVDDGISRFDGTLNATGGGALTGTWSDLGTVTTIDINGGTIDGSTVGATSASSGKFTTIEATGLLTLSTTAAITASTTQTQGQQPLTTTINNVSICANPNDTVTLPAAAAGLVVYIFNNGAQTLQVFPASGDAIDGAAADAAVTQAAGTNLTYIAHDTTNWNTIHSPL